MSRHLDSILGHVILAMASNTVELGGSCTTVGNAGGQELCLHIIATQLKDKVEQSYKSEIIKFNKEMQDIIFDRFSKSLINNPRS